MTDWLAVVVFMTGVTGMVMTLRLLWSMVWGHSREGSPAKQVQESLDNLPSGIAFFDKNGLPRLCNRRMYSLEHLLAGRDIQSVQEFREALDRPCEAVSILNPKAMVYRFPEGEVWRFSESSVVTKSGERFVQFLAGNVTALYENGEELKRENERLKRVALSMKELSHNILTLTREEEILEMKMRVHDELGHTVLATNRFLTNGMEEMQEKELLKRWNRALWLLQTEEADSPGKGWRAQLEERGNMLGLKVVVRGELSTDEKGEDWLMPALSECMINSVRHGGATELEIDFTNQRDYDTVRVSNNGSVPEEGVVEGGGLSTLRRRVESSCCQMAVSTAPVFSVTFRIPKFIEEPEERAHDKSIGG